MRTLPDGLTGAIMAVEGISDAAVMLHGPGGCRIRHMVLSTAVYPREDPDRGSFTPYYYGYPRVPSTYLDEYDYINGAFYKSEEGLETIGSRSPSLIAVIDSPGASLIGDDHDRAIRDNDLGGIAMRITIPTASVPAPEACGKTLEEVMEFLDPPERVERKGTVNILGLSLMDKDWRAAREELEDIVQSMGLEVICVPGAGSSVKEMVDSVNAEFNIVVCPEMCSGLLEWYERRGVGTIRSPAGAPVGFDATEAWIKAVAEATGKDPTEALRKVKRCRGLVYERFTGMRYNALRIRGLSFSIAGTASIVRPLTEWLYRYLAMAPEAVKADDGGDPEEVQAILEFLEDTGFGYAWDREPVPSGVVLCEGVTALTMKIAGQCMAGIPIGYSSMGLDDILPRPVYGTRGALFILDEILHGVRGS